MGVPRAMIGQLWELPLCEIQARSRAQKRRRTGIYKQKSLYCLNISAYTDFQLFSLTTNLHSHLQYGELYVLYVCPSCESTLPSHYKLRPVCPLFYNVIPPSASALLSSLSLSLHGRTFRTTPGPVTDPPLSTPSTFPLVFFSLTRSSILWFPSFAHPTP